MSETFGSPVLIRNKVHARCYSWEGYEPYSELQPVAVMDSNSVLWLALRNTVP